MINKIKIFQIIGCIISLGVGIDLILSTSLPLIVGGVTILLLTIGLASVDLGERKYEN